jgi:O-antigen/teichoic acid export membrane protein
LVSLPILAHALGVLGRGEVAAVTAPLMLIATVATFGLPDAVTYAVARSSAFSRSLALRAVGLCLAGGLLGFAAVAVVATLVSDSSHDVVVRSLPGVLIGPMLVVGVLRGAASGLGAWDLVLAERGLAAALRLVSLVVLALTGELTVLSAVAAILLAPVLAGIAYIPLARRRDAAAPASDPGTKGLVSYGARVWTGALSGMILARIDQTLMVPLAGERELGLYVVAVSLSELPLVINLAVRDVSFATQAAEARTERLARAARLSSSICMCAAILLGMALPFSVDWLLGPGFRDGLPAMFVLLFAVAIGTPGSIAGAGLAAAGRPGLRSASLAVACVVNVALIFVLVPLYGALGAAVATLAGNLVSSNLNIVAMRRITGIRGRSFYGLRRGDLAALGSSVRSLVARRRGV